MGSIAAFQKPKLAEDLTILVEECLRDLESLNRSPHMIKGYGTDLALSLKFYKGSLEVLTDETIRAYFARVREQSQSPATQAGRRASLKAFL
ncbi:site-specific integrase [bacterium]|nr:site-specific integrase [bacterium]